MCGTVGMPEKCRPERRSVGPQPKDLPHAGQLSAMLFPADLRLRLMLRRRPRWP